jgi:hypothetical protein
MPFVFGGPPTPLALRLCLNGQVMAYECDESCDIAKRCANTLGPAGDLARDEKGPVADVH